MDVNESPKIEFVYKNTIEAKLEKDNKVLIKKGIKTNFPVVILNYQNEHYVVRREYLFTKHDFGNEVVNKFINDNMLRFRELFRYLSGATTLNEIKDIVGEENVYKGF